MFSAQQRRTLAPSKFGQPSLHKYPVDTRGRARAAISYSTHQNRIGNLSDSAMRAIHAKAHARLAR
jgi:hypothetical protein